MKRPARRARLRAALLSSDVPTWESRPRVAASADALRFQPAPGVLPRGRRVYAVGDVHGCRDQLAALHGLIAQDLTARPIDAAVVVHLGDYISHGPDSAGVIELLTSTALPGAAMVNLIGDHERMLLDALAGDRASATDFLWSGGRSALASWGANADRPRELWVEAIPAHHLAFMRGLVTRHREGEYLFVHAGLRPRIPLRRQTRDDMLGIRQPFLWSEYEFGFVVVHGHSAEPAPVTRTNRIGVDTGAGFGGKLTCVVLEDDRLALMQV